MERDIKYSTLLRVEEFIKKNQPIWKTQITIQAHIDYNSVISALNILEKQGKIKYVGDKPKNKQIVLT